MEARKDTEGGRGIDMMKKTVQENEIESTSRNCLRGCDIGDEKISVMAISSQLDVPVIDIDSQVLRMSEVRSVVAGSATDVQDRTDIFEIIMFQNPSELLAREGQLREVEHEWLFEQRVKEFHGRQ